MEYLKQHRAKLEKAGDLESSEPLFGEVAQRCVNRVLPATQDAPFE